ncbi:hypothetical protein SAMD00023353_2300310 [Rosellinia necatrix]|uniref:IgE-binding protein n=1 Tax=Rosellinia necatrix TaxID=77044 RepID=A0A1W2TGK9_ROSNE|nr:hypothetical protein SAMD00023353_2300310 [Rosellinia necatrix]
MKGLLAVIAFPVAALAASIPREALLPTPSGPFSAGAWKIAQGTDTFFFGTAINASGGKFYINRNTSTYCPGEVPGLDCSAYSGSGTTFVIGNGTTTMSLEVTVPGGQQVYLAPDGSLSYTQAHSAAMPPGSVVTGFSRAQSEAFGAPTYLYSASQYWYLCPVTEGEPRERTYQIFASSEGPEGCLGTQIRTYTPGAGHVWQYA